MIAELDHFIGGESYQLISKEGALYLQKFGEAVDSSSKKNCVMTTGQLLSIFRQDLYRLDLSGLDLSNTNFNRANFDGSNLRGTNFSNSTLIEASCEYADMESVNLSDTDLSNAMLRYVNLSHVICNQTIFVNTNLFCVNFSGTRLNANMSGADVTLVSGVTFASLMEAKFDEHTKFVRVKLRAGFNGNWNLQQLEQVFGKSDDPENVDVFAVVDSMHPKVKLHVVRSLIFSLQSTDVSGVAGNFRKFFDENPDTKKNQLVAQFIEDNKIYSEV